MPTCCHCDKIQHNVYFEWSRGLVAQGYGEATHLTGAHGGEEALFLMVAKKTWTQKGGKDPSDAHCTAESSHYIHQEPLKVRQQQMHAQTARVGNVA